MIRKLKNGREVEIVDIEYGRDAEDTQIVAAFYLDVEGESGLVSDEDLDELNELCFETLQERWLERQIARAERFAEGDR